MAVFEFWRDITPGSPLDTVDRYQYDTSDDSIAHDSFTVGSGVLGPIHPVFGTVMYTLCDGGDLVQYKSTGSSAAINKVTTVDSPTCCTLALSDFSIVRTNNTVLLTPNGTITITAPILDIGDYEATIDGGSTWETQVGGEIVFSGLGAGTYEVIIREISGVCNVTSSVIIADNISYPPLIASENTLPPLYSPIFHAITLGYTLDNNEATIKNDGETYLEVVSDDAKDYLATLPIIKILQNEDYQGTYQVTGVDDPLDPAKFYIDAVFTTEQVVLFVPYDRQVFQLFAETAFNVYEKAADITVYPSSSGEYLLRLEGFLQGVFRVAQPVNLGDEITLLRKYYVVPQDFDMEDSPTIFNAVYSAIEDLTPYLEDLTPLGPAPINFINEQTAKGFPVLFSYIDTATGRIKNVTSSQQSDIVSSSPTIYIPALPFNQYTVTWINPGGAIAGPIGVTPALPAWITMSQPAADTIQLDIDTSGGGTGDYDGSDYLGDDYLTGGPNGIVGCYSFDFDDDGDPLFSLEICIFPIQKSDTLCGPVINVAWVNREGGWSSYAFNGRKTYGKDIGEVKTFKSGLELRRASVEEVYDTIEVSVVNKAQKDLTFLASLRQSIQAFMYDDLTEQWSIPIVLDKQSFAIYSDPFRALDINQKIVFKLAEEVVIQTQ